ncbi:hypothetical protein EON67_02290, partial [archaeon]
MVQVNTLMWDGTKYSSEPNAGHARVFDTTQHKFVIGMHPHGAIPLGGALLRPQLHKWPFLNKNLLFGVANALFVRCHGALPARAHVARPTTYACEHTVPMHTSTCVHPWSAFACT